MKTGLNRNLLIVDLLAVIFIIVIILLPSSVLRIMLGLPFLFFFPGYTLLAAILPGGQSGGGIERVALSFGISFMVVALAGLVLNFTAWGIRLYPLLVILAAVIVSSSLVAWFRHRRSPSPGSPAPGARQGWSLWRGAGLTGKILTFILGVFILVAAGSLVYTFVIPAAGESFTEFYILGKDGQVQDYPVTLRAGEETEVTAVVVSHEAGSASYYLELAVNGVRRRVGEAFILKNGEKWQGEAVFSLDAPGNGQKVEFILHKDDAAYRQLYLLVDVTG